MYIFDGKFWSEDENEYIIPPAKNELISHTTVSYKTTYYKSRFNISQFEKWPPIWPKKKKENPKVTFLHQWIVQFSKNCTEIWKITFYTYQSLKLSSKWGSLVERSPFCTQPPWRWYILQLPLNALEKRKPCVIYKHMRVIPIILWGP